MSHVNPYRITDHENIFELGENSSHPELNDAERVWKFYAYTFKTATEAQKFFESEGINPKTLVIEPRLERGFAGKNKIIIHIVEKHNSKNAKALKGFSA